MRMMTCMEVPKEFSVLSNDSNIGGAVTGVKWTMVLTFKANIKTQIDSRNVVGLKVLIVENKMADGHLVR